MARCQHSPRSVAPGRVRPVLAAHGSRPRGDARCRQARAGVLRPKSKAPNSFSVRLCTFPGGSPEDPEPGLGCRGGQGPTETAVAGTALGLLECNCRPKPAEINLGNFLGIPRELCMARQRSGRSSPRVGAGVPRVSLPRPAWGDSTNAHGPGAARCEARPEAAEPALAFMLLGRAAGGAGRQTKRGLSQLLSWHGPSCVGAGGCLPRERRASPPR